MEGIIPKLKHWRRMLYSICNFYPKRKSFGKICPTTIIASPSEIGNPQMLFADEWVNIRYGVRIINTNYEKVIIKKYTVLAPHCTIITNSHCPTVGIPMFFLCDSHINDKSGDVVINEDVWVGANCTILADLSIGRGAIVGACSIVTKDIPPYAVAVGCPARIVGVRFSKEGIIRHERALYNEQETLSITDIDYLFDRYYSNLKIIGKEEELSKENQNKLNRTKSKFTTNLR